MTKTEWTICNLCASDETEDYCAGRDRQLGGANRFHLVRCQQCGLIYLNPRPSKDAMGRYYPQDYEPFVRSSCGPSEPLTEWGYHRYVDKRCRAVMRWKAGGRLLDVGCATGDFLAHMAKYGWQVHGVEPSLAASRRARQMHDLDVRTGDLEQARFPDGYFDVVTLWDVLEHLHDPLGSLKEIHRILKSDGVLVIELPNTQSFDAMLFGTYWIGLDIPRHLYVFPPAPLEAMLEETGLQIVSRQCFSGGYGAFLLSLRFWLEDRRYDKLGRLIDRLSRGPLLRLLLFPYIRLGYVLGRGPEMTLFCRKLQTQ